MKLCYLRQNTPFLPIREDSGDCRLQHNHTILVPVSSLSDGPAIFVNGSDGEVTGDGVFEINRFFETKVHAGCQPPDLTADLGDDTGRQEPMTDFPVKLFGRCKAFVKVNRVIVPGDFGKLLHIRFRKRSRYRKGVPCSQPFDCLFTNFSHAGFTLFEC